jgi:hypothetical protein
MFGITLRAFHHRMSRLSESRTERGQSLWDALYSFVQERGSVTRQALLDRFSADDETLVRGVLRELVDAGMLFRSGAAHATFYRAARSDEQPERGASDGVERLASLLWVAIQRLGPIDIDRLSDVVPADPDDMEAALSHLVAHGRIGEQRSKDGRSFAADTFLIPVGDSAGWEAAVFDHYQALVTTIATKLRLGGRQSATDDWVGGSTYSIELDRDHPLFEEVTGFLRATRERAVSLRRRVEELNVARGDGGVSPLRVLIYMGQSVSGLEDEDDEE